MSKTTRSPSVNNQPLKRQKLQSAHLLQDDHDKIDPVEKLLSISHIDNDILHMDETESLSPAPSVTSANATSNTPTYPDLSQNLSRMINDNLRSYYMNFRKSPIEIHNDHSSFSVLNQKQPDWNHKPVVDDLLPRTEIPFFKNVNFNPSPFGLAIEDYIYYGNEEEDEQDGEPNLSTKSDQDDPLLATDSEHEELGTPKSTAATLSIPSLANNKMCFHYRQSGKLSLCSDLVAPQICFEDDDMSKFLNQRSLLSGRASEMLGASNLKLHDFFL